MKLDLLVEPVDILSFDYRRIIVKDVLCHLSFQIKKVEADRKGKQWKIADIYRDVAADLLKFAGVAVSDLEPDELHRRTVNIVQ